MKRRGTECLRSLNGVPRGIPAGICAYKMAGDVFRRTIRMIREARHAAVPMGTSRGTLLPEASRSGPHSTSQGTASLYSR